MRDFITGLDDTEDELDISSVVLSDLITYAGIQPETSVDFESQVPKLLQIYDKLVRNWVTSLPLKTSAQIRLAKFKIVRKIAIEICLGSTTISLRNKATVVPESVSEPAPNDFILPFHGTPRRPSRPSSPNIMLSQSVTTDATSAQSDTASSVSEVIEDAAISRLRQYAVSVKSRPDMSAGPAWLSDWPSATGVDPNGFSWEAAQAATDSARINSDDEDDEVTRREAARRRRRTEKFLRRERSNATQIVSSQIEPVLVGTQPNIHIPPAFSSQAVEDIPMTQPNRGAFGSRPALHKTPKKAKKRRAAGF